MALRRPLGAARFRTIPPAPPFQGAAYLLERCIRLRTSPIASRRHSPKASVPRPHPNGPASPRLAPLHLSFPRAGMAYQGPKGEGAKTRERGSSPKVRHPCQLAEIEAPGDLEEPTENARRPTRRRQILSNPQSLPEGRGSTKSLPPAERRKGKDGSACSLPRTRAPVFQLLPRLLRPSVFRLRAKHTRTHTAEPVASPAWRMGRWSRSKRR